MIYGIRKKSRSGNSHSYTGPTWKSIGVHKPPTSFKTQMGAQLFADMLSANNLVGFEVFLLKEE